jgi:penicillin-binding protein 1A
VVLAALVVLVSAAAWSLVAWGTWYIHDLGTGLPDRAAMSRLGEMAQATTVFDRHDRPVFTIFKEQRIEVPLAQVSPIAIKAFVAIEDQRFFEHRGIDLVRVVAAAFANLREGRAAQGGSTITQQLARQGFLTRDKTVRRKLKEVILAARIERLYAKEEILELYLNKAYFGDGLYGIEAASRGFFGKHASELTLAEAALLAGLVKSPSTYAPTVSLERAAQRRNVVLDAMRETGAIDEPEWQAVRAEPVALKDALRSEEPYGQYFKEQVRLELVDQFGWERVYEGGLRVFTTIDIDLQKAAEPMLEEALVETEAKRQSFRAYRTRPGAVVNPADRLQGALIALDPRTGHVRVMIGGRSFEESRFNRATQARRQPGSAFKPFVFAAALEAGYSPASLIEHLDAPVQTLQGDWTPEDEHSEADAMTLRTALRTSSNRAAVRLLEDVGMAHTVAYAKRLGVGSVPSVPSLALGSGEVTLDSMASAFAAFANGGYVRKPVLIRRVEDRDGTLLFEPVNPPERAISDVTAFLMATMLADVVNHGTAYRARASGFTLPAGGKTGTTNDYNDAWFVGFTPSMLAGVWVGFDQPRTILPNGYAGELAVPVWGRFMKLATKDDRPVWFEPPSGLHAVEVCRLTGRLPSAGCYDAEIIRDGKFERRSLVYTDYFVAGASPLERCPLHDRSFLDRIAGLSGAREAPPVPVEHAPPPAPPPTTVVEPARAQTTVADAAPAEPVKKKRGFWSRVFGRRDRADTRDEKPRAKPGTPR